jgi:AcrR family transcriptional regulator
MPNAPSRSIPPRQGLARRLDRAAVVAAAAEIADRSGLDAVTLTAVANLLGVRAPSLYAHVESLSKLLSDLATLGLREMDEVLTRATLGRSGQDALLALARAYRAHAHARPGSYAAGVACFDRSDAAALAAGEALLATTLGVLAPDADPESDATIHRVRILRAGLHGFVSLEMAGAFGFSTDVETTFERLVDSLTA